MSISITEYVYKEHAAGSSGKKLKPKYIKKKKNVNVT